MKKVIFFDLDGTLTPMKTWYVFNKRFGLTDEEDEGLFQKYLANQIDYSTWTHEITSLLKERGLCTKEAVESFAGSIEIRDGAQELINLCKQQGYTTILLSGAIQQIATNFAARLGIDESFGGAEVSFNEDGSLSGLVKGKDEAMSKLTTFEKICAEHGVDPVDTIMVGDGGNDLDIFKKTKKGILLGNYEPLKEYAWKQVQSLSEIEELL